MYTEHKHQTERLIFEGIEPEQDLEWYHKLRSDPSVAQWLEPNIVAPWTKAKGAKSLQVDGALVEVIIKLPNESDPKLSTPIGWMGLAGSGPGMEHHRRAEFYIVLSPEFHGKGYGTEALQWLLEVGFRRANLNRIDGRYDSVNLPAKKCYERLGFKLEGVARQYIWLDGEYIDLVNIGQLRSEWEERQKKGESTPDVSNNGV